MLRSHRCGGMRAIDPGRLHGLNDAHRDCVQNPRLSSGKFDAAFMPAAAGELPVARKGCIGWQMHELQWKASIMACIDLYAAGIQAGLEAPGVPMVQAEG